MKKRDLEQRLAQGGFVFVRSGKHDTWARGSVQVSIPKHKEIGEKLARKILKDAGLL